MSICQSIEPDTASAESNFVKIEGQIKTFLLSQFPAFNKDKFNRTTPLLDNGEIDSLGLIELVGFLEETYGLEFDDADFETENLETLHALTLLVSAKATQ